MIDFANAFAEFSFQLLGDTGEGDRFQDVIVDDFIAVSERFMDTKFVFVWGDCLSGRLLKMH